MVWPVLVKLQYRYMTRELTRYDSLALVCAIWVAVVAGFTRFANGGMLIKPIIKKNDA